MIETSLDPGHGLTAIANELIDARLQAGSTIRFTIPTWSMAPTLQPGDQVLVSAVKPVDLRLGDILVIRQQGAWLVHRLIGPRIRSGNSFLLLKGDNTAQPDSPYTVAALYGIVNAVERAGHTYSFRSTGAVRLGRVMASLSGLEASLNHVRPYIVRKVVLKGIHLLLLGLATLGKRVIL